MIRKSDFLPDVFQKIGGKTTVHENVLLTIMNVGAISTNVWKVVNLNGVLYVIKPSLTDSRITQ